MVWAGTSDRRLPARVRDCLADPDQQLAISAVTAWEFRELQLRNRIPGALDLGATIADLELQLLDLPARSWEVVAALPDLHRDPVDRMLIGHAIAADLTLLTSDAVIRRYPVKTFW